ncbi:hypothetical protein B5C34_08650 [Pacificimonas flava]|uniref:DUF177 domain-containing protein n=2 Tax=Pacificimonas TaxID=1960290 RepID=A0A219B561_9SPHN|nr:MULTISPECIES: DUF177 domain-containing protein [Pacificimonas]MBZ6379268.1 DUF177 domain-containing protein [Pacificimonas aurantium]OWV33522.1 hypothetical protein B5C34_08650 [Pacificimonas flava]
MSAAEFSRIVRVDEVRGGLAKSIEATETERKALARRFDLIRIESLGASLELAQKAEGVEVRGTVYGEAVASCVVSAEEVAQSIEERVDILLVEGLPDIPGDDELELGEVDLDRLPLEGGRIDLGEIAAMTFALGLDPYPRAAETTLAEARRHLMTEEEAAAQEEADRMSASPFSKLKN